MGVTTPMAVLTFGKMQLQIMQVLWEKGRCSARAITDALNKTQPVAHSTVQTLLRKLEAKGAIGHETAERTFVYYPLAQETKVRRNATRDLVDRVFGGSVGGLLSYLIEHERLLHDEQEKARKLIGEYQAR
jgi:BlaI family penicillinase repressor